MENPGIKSKKNRRRRRHRGNRGKNNKSAGGSRVFSLPKPHEASLGIPMTFTMPAQSTWFWQNYRQAMDWQGRHQVAYWKSRALAVECQNSILMNYVEKMHIDKEDEYLPNSVDDNNDEDEQDIEEDIDGESLVFEVNAEMRAFFEQSIKHKLEMKELKNAECSQAEAIKIESENFVFPEANPGIVESALLYGKNAPAIMSMETSMQLTFERFLERGNPQLWPNIPLNL